MGAQTPSSRRSAHMNKDPIKIPSGRRKKQIILRDNALNPVTLIKKTHIITPGKAKYLCSKWPEKSKFSFGGQIRPQRREKRNWTETGHAIILPNKKSKITERVWPVHLTETGKMKTSWCEKKVGRLAKDAGIKNTEANALLAKSRKAFVAMLKVFGRSWVDKDDFRDAANKAIETAGPAKVAAAEAATACRLTKEAAARTASLGWLHGQCWERETDQANGRSEEATADFLRAERCVVEAERRYRIELADEEQQKSGQI